MKELMRRASDSDLDPGIHRDCAADVHFYCANRAADEVHSCLRDNLESLSRQCRDREKKMEVQESADLRLKPVISSTCSAEIVKFCSTVSDEESPGAVLMCLEDHSSADGFGIKCRSLIYEEQKRQAGSISLNAPIARYCAKPLQTCVVPGRLTQCRLLVGAARPTARMLCTEHWSTIKTAITDNITHSQ